MPELPEVETVRRTLADKIEGRRIVNVDVRLPRLIKWPSVDEFIKLITGKRIAKVGRKGKYLLLQLEASIVLVIHLRMTGRLYYVEPGGEDKFTRIVFALDDGNVLIYADARTLGTLYALPAAEVSRIHGLATLGPEPLSAEFTLTYLRDMLAKRKSTIKACLLNQQIIGGLGNIYVDESLALAGILPERSASSLSAAETEKLYHAINEVIAQGIEHGGTTFRDYRDGLGRSGDHQHHLFVYGRKAQPCRKCGTPIIWKEVAGRGTHYCPHCQH